MKGFLTSQQTKIYICLIRLPEKKVFGPNLQLRQDLKKDFSPNLQLRRGLKKILAQIDSYDGT